jgi:hypothetical protein
MNRRKHANIVPLAALVRWILAAFFLMAAGLSYVYMKNEMQATGNEIRNLEAELSSLQTQDDSARAQIDRLSSHSYLERRLSEGFIKLTPIRDDSIVRLRGPGRVNAAAATASLTEDDLQPVSNRLGAQ